MSANTQSTALVNPYAGYKIQPEFITLDPESPQELRKGEGKEHQLAKWDGGHTLDRNKHGYSYALLEPDAQYDGGYWRPVTESWASTSADGVSANPAFKPLPWHSPRPAWWDALGDEQWEYLVNTYWKSDASEVWLDLPTADDQSQANLETTVAASSLPPPEYITVDSGSSSEEEPAVVLVRTKPPVTKGEKQVNRKKKQKASSRFGARLSSKSSKKTKYKKVKVINAPDSGEEKVTTSVRASRGEASKLPSQAHLGKGKARQAQDNNRKQRVYSGQGEASTSQKRRVRADLC
ncbi:hypothetical protein RHS01_10146 [Rhizoctonia solani]|uniref:Uncharacterized protein n=1 Tax=Rhizoctonia solani TaxID=456999 RepID=A0A8H7M0T6_9AGAM|nr:hypothetical protein RHS01_10146 [Rhizoctonia solani]